ncbi:MAG TPA: SPFH domain-containing protein [Planctomycetota bacterium]|nr:SPFH domain-containing protein [Planctomycetota bacterium]
MPIDSKSFIEKYGARTISYAVGIGLGVLLLLIAASTCAHSVKNTEIAIIVNNITGNITTYDNGGMVIHLPFGLSSVELIDKKPMSMRLARDVKTKEHPEGDQVKVKTNDGSNVEVDIEIIYQIDIKNAYIAYRELVENKTVNAGDEAVSHDSENNMESILRAVVRSEVRNQLGMLDTAEIVDPEGRNRKIDAIRDKLSDYFRSMGVEIVSVNAQNFHFNEQYEEIVRQRKSAEQIYINQKDFQKTAQKTRERKIAEANKDRSNAMTQLQGEVKKKILEADGMAKRTLTKAQQEAYEMDRQGDIELAKAEQEAAAIKAEGEQKAQAMEELFKAYEHGGEGLVREALVKLYDGVNLTAKPYAPSERIERMSVVPAQLEKGGANGR